MKGEPEFLDVWNEVYGSVMTHARAHDGYSVSSLELFDRKIGSNFWYQYRIVDMNRGHAISTNVDSLSAFWAGLQVLAGDIEGAIKSHLFCELLRYQLIDLTTSQIGIYGGNIVQFPNFSTQSRINL